MELTITLGATRQLIPWLPGATLCAFGMLSACATANLTYLANGQPAYQVNCDLGLKGFNRCYRKAAEICGPRGFIVYDWQGRALPIRNADPSEFDATGWEDRTILVACPP